MRYRAVGNSGLVVSTLGLGCNSLGRRVDQSGAQAVVDAALEVGITLFDTADSYANGESERLLGRALGKRRDEVVLATKFGHDAGGPQWEARGSRRYIRQAVEASLRRLGTDYVDLYQYHSPDGVTPIAETLAALDELVTAGKVRYAGSSNFAAWQVADAEWSARSLGRTRFISAQNHYNLINRTAEAELVPCLKHYDVGLLPYFPLARGLLTGKYRRGAAPPPSSRLAAQTQLLTEDAFERVEALESYASQRGLSLLDVAIGALAAQPAVSSVIAGATSPEQVRANYDAAAWAPTASDLDDLNLLTQ